MSNVKQVGGTHYSKHKVQVWEIIDLLYLNYYRGNILKYLVRYRDKGGSEDLYKAISYADHLANTDVANDFRGCTVCIPTEKLKDFLTFIRDFKTTAEVEAFNAIYVGTPTEIKSTLTQVLKEYVIESDNNTASEEQYIAKSIICN